jgi:hypothetical protein
MRSRTLLRRDVTDPLSLALRDDLPGVGAHSRRDQIGD